MDEYFKKQQEIESNFKKELKELLEKYRASFEVERDELTIEVECEWLKDESGDIIEPYVYFSLPRFYP